MFESTSQRRRSSSGTVIAAIVIIAGAAVGFGWFECRGHEQREKEETVERIIQSSKARARARDEAMVPAALPGMSLEMPGRATVTGTYQDGEATAGEGKLTATVRWRTGELPSKEAFTGYVRRVAGGFVGEGRMLTTSCADPQDTQLDGRPALRCEVVLVSLSPGPDPARPVPPYVQVVMTTCGGRVVDQTTTSSGIEARMMRSFHCTPDRR